MVNTGLFVYGQASDFDYSIFSEIESCGVSVVSLLSNIDVDYLNTFTKNRIDLHRDFLFKRNADTKKANIKHYNKNLDMQVMTSQETEIKFFNLIGIEVFGKSITAKYENYKL